MITPIKFVVPGALALSLSISLGDNTTNTKIALKAPSQDQGLPYTRTARDRGLKAIKDYVVVFANDDYGSRYGYVKGYKVRFDNARVLEGEAISRDGVIYVPTAFSGVLALTEIKPEPAPDFIKEKWVYTLPVADNNLSPSAKTIEVKGHTYVALADLALAQGKKVYQNRRGLLVIGDKDITFNDKDPILLDDVVTLFDTPDKLADPDIATAYVPMLKAQGKWIEHARATPEQLKLLQGPPTEWQMTPESDYDYAGFNKDLLGSKVPAPGVYPRLLFSEEDVPMLLQHMKANKLGQKTLIEWDVLFKKTWWNPASSDGQVFAKLATGDVSKLQWPEAPAGTPLFMIPHGTFRGQTPGIATSHTNYVTNCLTTMALYCLLIGDETHGKQAAAAIYNYYKLVEPMVDEVNRWSDSEFGTSTELANFAETAWRGMHGVVAHMDLGLALDFSGKWMSTEQKDFMRRVIVKATYGRRDNMQAAPQRARDVNHLTWHFTSFLAASAIEGLEGCDPEVLQAGQDSARAFCEWGIDKNGQMFESNGKSGGGMQFNVLTMNVLARRGLNLWGHPHWRKLLGAQVQTTSPDGHATVSSGTWGGSPFVTQSTNEIKAFYPAEKAADYLLTQQFPELNLAAFDPQAYRAKLEKSISGVRLPGPTYPGFTFSGLYDSDWQQVSRKEAGLPLTFDDPVHGILSGYSDATPEATWLCLHVRANQYIGSGHHHADVGMFYMSALGVNWITESPFPKSYDGKYHNEVLIDGIAEPDGLPARGEYLGASVAEQAALGTVNQTRSYTYRWMNQIIQWRPLGNDIWDKGAAIKDWELETDDPLPISVYKGTSHYKSRPWWPTYTFSNWLPVLRAKFNPVEYAYRTAGMVRGQHPYALVVDDLKKDNKDHLYQWTAMLGAGVWQANVPGLSRNEVVLARKQDLSGDLVKAGSPMLLIQALEGAGAAEAKVETAVDGEADSHGKLQKYDRVAINVREREAHFKILLIPFRMGEAVPHFQFDSTKQKATAGWSGQNDVVEFQSSDARTRLSVTRDNQNLVTSK